MAFCSSWNLCNHLARTSSLCSSEYVSSFAISSNFRFSLSISTCLAIDLAIADLREPLIVLNSLSRPSSSLRACSHEPGTVNYPGVMIAPGQVLPRVHMMICCPGAMLPRGNVAPGQLHCPGASSSSSDQYEFI